MNCFCNQQIHPPELAIDSGLDVLPRQVASFSQFRWAMLNDLENYNALSGWRDQGGDNLGMMLLEMWAYMCDVLSFYDQAIANESYVRTARNRSSLRKLVGLLGYIPRPPVAASGHLALFADGKKAVHLPRGIAFRSGAFGHEAPQIFELDQRATIHSGTNRWDVKSPRATIWGQNRPFLFGTVFSRDSLLFEKGTATFQEDDLILVSLRNVSTPLQATSIKEISKIRGGDGARYDRVSFDRPIALTHGTPLNTIRLSQPNQKAYISSIKRSGSASSSSRMAITKENFGTYDQTENLIKDFVTSLKEGVGPLPGKRSQGDSIILDSSYRKIRPGDPIILTGEKFYEAFEVIQASEIMATLNRSQLPNEATTSSPGTAASSFKPSINLPFTQLTLDRGLQNYDLNDLSKLTVHFDFMPAGTLRFEADSELSPMGLLKLVGPFEILPDNPEPSRFLLQDKNNVGVEVRGSVNLTKGELTLGPSNTSDMRLVTPVKALGNVVRVTRGETVQNEILGSGDASIPNQSFTLKKKPLTYLSAPTVTTEQGIASTLEVWIDGVKWKEVPTFFGTGPADEVYVVRHNDEGETNLTFGNGKNGKRLSTGVDNVVARYRFGAGAITPPAGSINQMAKPIKGIKSIHNPVPAAGGADAEKSESIREHAPRSALILGRAVSNQDFEAVAAGIGGVKAVKGEWNWHGIHQNPVFHIWYIGDTNIAGTILQTLRSIADPSLSIAVNPAQSQPLTLSLSIQINPRFRWQDVHEMIRSELTNPQTGILAPEKIGIGRPLYRSRIYEKVLSITGVLAVTHLVYDGIRFDQIAINPGSDRFFDLENGKLEILLDEQGNGSRPL